MEEDEMPAAQGCKFPRNHNHINNDKIESVKGGVRDEEDGDEEIKRGRFGGGGDGQGQNRDRGGGGNISNQVDISNSGGSLSRLCNWPTSRIFRVSRASGGKDRHSKVWTSKGLRDRRVRLSVPTAIQFYDLQDRLGYDQPSKAVEWLLTAASTSISELPSISTPFPDTPQQLTDGRRSNGGDNEKRFDLAEIEVDDDENMIIQQGGGGGEGNVVKNLCKSGCSSTSETSKGSGLSFSRPESRIKARERARERAAGKEKEKEKEENDGSRQRRHQNLNPISQNAASFTELLTGGSGSGGNGGGGGGGIHSPNGNGHNHNSNGNECNFFQKSQREWINPSTSMDYFGTANFLGQIQLGNPIHQQFSVTGDQNQQYSFLPDHLVVRGGGSGGGGGGGGSNSNNNNGDYNLNFSVTCSSSTSGLAGFNRGTLQSNSSSSPSMIPHNNQRFLDGTSANFFLSPTTPVVTNASTITPVENHYHHFLSGFDPQLQLCYDNNNNNNNNNTTTNRHHDHKGKGKNSAS